MGKRWFSADRFLGGAVLASLVVHAIVAYVIPPLAKVPSPNVVEAISFNRVQRLDISRRVSARPAAAAPHPKPVAQPAATPARRPDPRERFHARKQVPRSVVKRASVVRPDAVAAASRPAMRPAPVVSANGTSAAASPHPRETAGSSVREVATTTQHHVAGGYMPFGADQPPVLDPRARQQLEALNVHVTLKIVVSDSGKTESVAFDPPISEQLESQIQALLASASWDPAYCGGGIPCEAPTTIKL